MKYISASEGLSGSLRVNLFSDERRDDSKQANVGFNASRIVYQGSNDLGGGMEATYLLELRPGEVSEIRSSSITPEYLDVGLKGAFGHFRIGAIESTTEALMPTADLTSDVGSSGRKLADDYEAGIRWVSPEIRGLVLGVSAETEDAQKQREKTIEQYDVVLAYSLRGFNLGLSYAEEPPGPSEASLGKYSSSRGVRFGMNYVRPKWALGYNLHRYKAAAIDIEGSGTGFIQNDATPDNLEYLSDTNSREHVVGARASVGRFDLALNYSRAELKNDNLAGQNAGDPIRKIGVEYITSALDIGYNLGRKTKVVAAYKVAERKGEGFGSEEGQISGGIYKIASYYLLYRIDF